MSSTVQAVYLIGTLVLKMWDRVNVKAGELPDEAEVQTAEELRRKLLELAASEASTPTQEPDDGVQQEVQGEER